ncbi:xanthine dehydrogenase family protein subunit M [Amycolatopsis sp. NBC_01488]|uniref:FAD binding domain-containing protein n=1 Tax=Amycolatopsis sp. NBC_01488 TaxID=2903563 RepID=UPI002E2DED22|nr:xanthine dehydrogenase family protein subunit M [Amycolatopsis sp. NBC_01488]
MKAFGYVRAGDIDEALALRGDPRRSRFLAGGTNLVDLMKTGVESPAKLVDIRALPLDRIEDTGDGGLRVGATVTNSDLAVHPAIRTRYPALSQAILSGASGQLRNAATVGGNLLQRTRCPYFADLAAACNKRVPGTGCSALTGEHHNHAVLDWTPACVATHPSDMAVALAAFDARIGFRTGTGPGELPISGFYRPVADGAHRETLLPEGALITHVVLPPSPPGPSRYRKVRERASYAFALCSIAATVEVHDGQIGDVRIALGGIAARPWRARAAEDHLRGKEPGDAVFRTAADAELASARPLPGNGYKVRLARNLIVSTLDELISRESR